jgi:hypothetical protein
MILAGLLYKLQTNIAIIVYASAITVTPAPDGASPQNGVMSQQFVTAHRLHKCAGFGQNSRTGNCQIKATSEDEKLISFRYSVTGF